MTKINWAWFEAGNHPSIIQKVYDIDRNSSDIVERLKGASRSEVGKKRLADRLGISQEDPRIIIVDNVAEYSSEFQLTLLDDGGIIIPPDLRFMMGVSTDPSFKYFDRIRVRANYVSIVGYYREGQNIPRYDLIKSDALNVNEWSIPYDETEVREDVLLLMDFFKDI